MNVCHFTGRLTADPELNEYGGASKVTFSLAISERRKDKESGETKDETSFLDFFAWASGAEAIAKYFRKGSLITVHAKAKQERWEKDGQKKSAVRFRVMQFEFPPFNSPRERDQRQVATQQNAPQNTQADDGGNGDIPF